MNEKRFSFPVFLLFCVSEWIQIDFQIYITSQRRTLDSTMNCDFCFRSGNFSKKIYIFTLQIPFFYIFPPNGRNIIFNKFSSRLYTLSYSLLCFRHISFKPAKRIKKTKGKKQNERDLCENFKVTFEKYL